MNLHAQPHLITLIIGRGTPVLWKLLFKDTESAKAAITKLDEQGDIEVTDDYGQVIKTAKANISAMMIENMTESREAHIALALHEIRLRSTLQSRVQSDPALKMALMSQGPAMLNPGGLSNGYQRN